MHLPDIKSIHQMLSDFPTGGVTFSTIPFEASKQKRVKTLGGKRNVMHRKVEFRRFKLSSAYGLRGVSRGELPFRCDGDEVQRGVS